MKSPTFAGEQRAVAMSGQPAQEEEADEKGEQIGKSVPANPEVRSELDHERAEIIQIIGDQAANLDASHAGCGEEIFAGRQSPGNARDRVDDFASSSSPSGTVRAAPARSRRGAQSGRIFRAASRDFRFSLCKTARPCSRNIPERRRQHRLADLQRDESVLESRRARRGRRPSARSRRAVSPTRSSRGGKIRARRASPSGSCSISPSGLAPGFQSASKRLWRSRHAPRCDCRWWRSRGKHSSTGRARSRFFTRC